MSNDLEAIAARVPPEADLALIELSMLAYYRGECQDVNEVLAELRSGK